MNVIPRSSWTDRDPPRQGATIDYAERPGVEFHHTVGTYGLPADDGPGIVKAIDGDHRGRGWNGVFYNALIDGGGQIVVARPWAWQSNSPLFTIVFPGNYDHRDLTAEQEQAAAELVAWLRAAGVGDEVRWHGDRAAASCPGRNVIDWIRAGGADQAPEPPTLEEIAMSHPDELVRKRVNEAVRLGQLNAAGTIAQMRKDFGLPPEPESDALWAKRIREGEDGVDYEHIYERLQAKAAEG